MGRHGIDRRVPAIGTEQPPDHGAWTSRRLTGGLGLSFTTEAGGWVSPGTGRLILAPLAGEASEPVAAYELARRRGLVILPGTGVKGAVRTLFEVVTGSCDPFDSRCRPRSMCPACAVFGRLGFTGRLSFRDAKANDGVAVAVRKVPVPHDPDRDKTRGEVRLYDLRRASERLRGERSDRRLPEVLPREAATGAFAGALDFWNLDAGELGAVLLCLGLSPEEGERFPLRLGGVKYHGQGAVRVAVTGARAVTGPLERETLDAETAGRAAARWLATGRQWLGLPGMAKLAELAAILGGGAS